MSVESNNPHIGSDVLAFLKEIIPDTPETRFVARRELFRISLTQALRNLRKRVGLTQEEVAARLGMKPSWVSKLESANNDHTFESVLAYLSVLESDFELSILLKGEKVAVVAPKLGMTQEEVDQSLHSVIEGTVLPDGTRSY